LSSIVFTFVHLPPQHYLSSQPHNHSFFRIQYKIFFVTSPQGFWYMLFCTCTFLQTVCHFKIHVEDSGRPIKLPKMTVELSELQQSTYNWKKQLSACALGTFSYSKFRLLQAQLCSFFTARSSTLCNHLNPKGRHQWN